MPGLRSVSNWGISEDSFWSSFESRMAQQNYGGGATPERVISFDDFTTDNDIGPIKNCLYLYDMQCDFMTDVFGGKSQNVHRSGVTRATDVWCVIERSQTAVRVFQKLYENTIKRIVVTRLSFIGQAGATTSAIVEVITFYDCFVTRVSPFRDNNFMPFSFTFSKVTWNQKDRNQQNPNNEIGSYEYTFDFNTNTGTPGA